MQCISIKAACTCHLNYSPYTGWTWKQRKSQEYQITITHLPAVYAAIRCIMQKIMTLPSTGQIHAQAGVSSLKTQAVTQLQKQAGNHITWNIPHGKKPPYICTAKGKRIKKYGILTLQYQNPAVPQAKLPCGITAARSTIPVTIMYLYMT